MLKLPSNICKTLNDLKLQRRTVPSQLDDTKTFLFTTTPVTPPLWPDNIRIDLNIKCSHIKFQGIKKNRRNFIIEEVKIKRVNNLCGIGSSFFFLTRLSHTPTVESSCPVTKNFSSKSTAATKSPCALLQITKYSYYLTKYLIVDKPLKSLKRKT